MLYWKTVAVASSTCFWLGDIDPLDGQNCIIRNSNSLQVLLCRMKDPRQWGRFWFWTWMLWIRNGSANRLKPTERNCQPIPHNWVFLVMIYFSRLHAQIEKYSSRSLEEPNLCYQSWHLFIGTEPNSHIVIWGYQAFNLVNNCTNSCIHLNLIRKY